MVSIKKEILEKLQMQGFVDKFAEKDRRMKLSISL
jgi:ribosomal protein S8